MRRTIRIALVVACIYGAWLLVSKVLVPSVGRGVKSGANSVTRTLNKAQGVVQRAGRTVGNAVGGVGP